MHFLSFTQLIKEKLLDLLGKEEEEGSHDENMVRTALDCWGFCRTEGKHLPRRQQRSRELRLWSQVSWALPRSSES